MSNDLETALDYVRNLISEHVNFGPFETWDGELKQLRRIEVLLMKLERLEKRRPMGDQELGS